MVDKDVVAGKIKQAEGNVQDAAGDVTGDTNANVAGKTKQAEGKVQEGVGHAKDSVRNALNKDQI
jgi:uncharacterized protein YjbJ (UPF0337 family)